MATISKEKFNMRFLGTGNAWSKPPHNYNNNVLVTSNQHKWLIDFGLLGPLALHDMGIPIADIDGIFVTHTHGDHVYGLEELAFKNYFIHHHRAKLWAPCMLFSEHSKLDGEDLWHNCLRASLETTLDPTGCKRLSLSDYFDVTLLSENASYDFFGVEIEIFAVKHVPHKPCYGLILNGEVAYTSDTTFDREKIDWLFAHGCHTIFHEVSFEPRPPLTVHTHAEEILTLPRHDAERIILMHYEDNASPQIMDRLREKGFRFATRDAIYRF